MKTRRIMIIFLALTLILGTWGGSALAADKIKLGWYFPQPHPYGEEVRKGVEQFERDYADEVEIIYRVGTESTPTSEQTNIEGMVAQGIRYISMFSSDTVSVNTLADELEPMGVNLGLFGGGAQKPTKTRFVVATDLKESARLATEHLIELLGGEGNIIVCFEGLGGSNTAREEGVDEALAAHPDIVVLQKIATSSGGVTTAEEAADKIMSSISANSEELDGFVCFGFNPTIGAITAFSEYFDNGGKHIPVVGIDMDPNIAKAIQDGVIEATLVQNSAAMGYISMMTLKYMAEGWRVKDDVYAINSGCAIVTKDNIADYQPALDQVRDQILADLTTVYLTKD